MRFDATQTPEFASNMPEYENEIWLLARKLNLTWEMLKSVMCDEILYRNVHALGFNSINKQSVAKVFSDRLLDYKSMTTQERHANGYKPRTLQRCIVMLARS